MWTCFVAELGNYMIRLWEVCITAGCPVTLWLNNRTCSQSVVEDFFRNIHILACVCSSVAGIWSLEVVCNDVMYTEEQLLNLWPKLRKIQEQILIGVIQRTVCFQLHQEIHDYPTI